MTVDGDVPASPAVARGARRLHITGGPGSGKSTLASRLGESLELPVFRLDDIAYEGPEFTERRLDERIRDVRSIAEAPEWIAEGIHLGWTGTLLDRADLIIWLDYVGWSRSAMRIVSRFTVSAVGEARARTGRARFLRFGDYRRHLRQLVHVLSSSRDYYRPQGGARRYPVSRDMAEQALRPYGGKVVRCRSRTDVEQLLESLSPAARP